MEHFHIVKAIARCGMATSPTDALRHQIERLAKELDVTNPIQAESLRSLLREDESSVGVVVQSDFMPDASKKLRPISNPSETLR